MIRRIKTGLKYKDNRDVMVGDYVVSDTVSGYIQFTKEFGLHVCIEFIKEKKIHKYIINQQEVLDLNMIRIGNIK